MIEFDIYQPTKHLEQVVELEKILWAGKTSEEIRDAFTWKYPADSELVNGFVALDGKRVVGFRGFFIQNYIKGKKVFPVAILGDAAVHPDYQRRGIFANLTRQALEYYRSTSMECVLALSSNAKSSPGYIKMGWKPFLRKEYRIGLPLFHLIPWFSPKKKGTTLRGYEFELFAKENIGEIAADLDIFCWEADGEKCISLRRDSHYWTWRFANPLWNTSFVVMRKEGKISGVVAFAPEKRRGIETIRVLDAVAPASHLYSILFEGLKRMTAAWVYLICSHSGIPETELWKVFPFVRRSTLGNPADFYLIKRLREDSVLAEKECWVINYSNID